MTMRSNEPGWELTIDGDHDRRGLWVRKTPGLLEICAGREGDDAYVALRVGEAITEHHLVLLEDVLDTAAFALEVGEDNRAYAAERAAEGDPCSSD